MKKIYCVYCGSKNNKKDKICKKCDKKLNPSENLIKEYVVQHIKDFFLDNIDGKITSVIYNFIKSHLYGFILAATLIFTGSTIINSTKLDDEIKSTSKRPNILLESLNKCNIDSAIEKEYICEEGYILVDNKCTKRIESKANVRLVCPNGYYLGGNKCYSNTSYEVFTKKECLLPNDKNAIKAYVEGDTCLVSWCASDDAWIDGECQAGYSEEESFTITNFCSQGTMVNGTCRDIKNSTNEYFCENGVLEEKNCIINEKKEAVKGCRQDYIYNEECNVCELEN